MSNIIHQLGNCQDCGMYWDDYRKARKQAREHAKKTGHRVNGETAICWSYNKEQSK